MADTDLNVSRGRFWVLKRSWCGCKEILCNLEINPLSWIICFITLSDLLFKAGIILFKLLQKFRQKPALFCCLLKWNWPFPVVYWNGIGIFWCFINCDISSGTSYFRCMCLLMNSFILKNRTIILLGSKQTKKKQTRWSCLHNLRNTECRMSPNG